mmetsp:Transcript_1622/g.3743  ORF Transcript_1622/g.3743 Transcript_1622/m.3743 type:complete len:223 (+) Transcript_1622:1074-1742(+)
MVPRVHSGAQRRACAAGGRCGRCAAARSLRAGARAHPQAHRRQRAVRHCQAHARARTGGRGRGRGVLRRPAGDQPGRQAQAPGVLRAGPGRQAQRGPRGGRRGGRDLPQDTHLPQVPRRRCPQARRHRRPGGREAHARARAARCLQRRHRGARGLRVGVAGQQPAPGHHGPRVHRRVLRDARARRHRGPRAGAPRRGAAGGGRGPHPQRDGLDARPDRAAHA